MRRPLGHLLKGAYLQPHKSAENDYFNLENCLKNLSLDSKPWITRGALKWLDEHLNEEMVGIEYGAGGSTPWLCRRLKVLYTYESNPKWAASTLLTMSQDIEMMRKWRLHFVNCNWNLDSTGRRWYIKGGHADTTSEETMIEMENDFLLNPSREINFAFIDGSIRYRSFVNAMELLREKPGSIICVDNSEKPHRRIYLDQLIPKHWKEYSFENKANTDDFDQSLEVGGVTSIFVVG